MASLYQLTGELMQLFEMLEDPEMDEQAVRDTMEAVEGEFDAKVDGWLRVIRSVEAEAKQLREEEKHLAARRQAAENNAKRMKGFVEECLRAAGRTEAGEILKAKIQKNGGVLPLRFKEGFEAKDAPDLYKRVEYSFDTDAIRAALDAGGVLDFVEYGERGESLRIK